MLGAVGVRRVAAVVESGGGSPFRRRPRRVRSRLPGAPWRRGPQIAMRGHHVDSLRRETTGWRGNGARARGLRSERKFGQRSPRSWRGTREGECYFGSQASGNRLESR